MSQGARYIHLLSERRPSSVIRYVLDSALALRKEGVRVTIYTFGLEAIDKTFRSENLHIRSGALRDGFFANSVKTLAGELRMERGRVDIHVHNMRDACIALIARRISHKLCVRVLLTQHIYTQEYSSVYNHLVKSGILGHIDCELSAECRGVRPIDGGPFDAPLRGAITALYHGRLCPEIGLEKMLGALALTNGIRLVIMGYGNSEYIDTLRGFATLKGVTERIDRRNNDYSGLDALRNAHFALNSTAMQNDYSSYFREECRAAGRPIIDFDSSASSVQLAESMQKLADEAESRRKAVLKPEYDSDI